MKLYLLVILSVALSFVAVAQQKEFILSGSLGVVSGETFTYILVFTDSAGKIKGYSSTYFEDKRNGETRAAISGSVDRANKTLTIKETEIIYNTGFYSNATICLIKCKLKLTAEGSKQVLVAAFNSADITNSTCASGSIRFEDEATINDLFAERTTATAEVKKTGGARIVVYDTASRNTKSAATDTVTKITAGIEKVYEWNSDSLVLDIWDGGKIDGDNITVVLNDKVVLSRYTIAASKRQLRLALLPKEINTLVIIANNTGNETPNTTNLELSDGELHYPVLAYNDAGYQARIRIRRK